MCTIPAPQIQQAAYDDEVVGMNNVDEQEVPNENNAYEEISNHVSGEDVVDLQNGHAEIEFQNIPQEVRTFFTSYYLLLESLIIIYIHCILLGYNNFFRINKNSNRNL